MVIIMVRTPKPATVKRELTQALLREMLILEPDTRVFRWRAKHGSACAGDVAGRDASGHWIIGIGGREYKAPALATFYATGEWPPAPLEEKPQKVATQHHAFGDPGPPLDAADYRPRVHGDPERVMAEFFQQIGKDYGGPLGQELRHNSKADVFARGFR
ncbi:hypothetical protein [Bradyrhizobium uaiense]|uniref:Uncharacterized protein n=1 Tax=Bradyrhizobium uaiense TaxID=2594946 RepID=A0A6P1BBT5_9BRAD|nr:hypothetical protein [Bradyrhizobium uaiense]NEU95664.1 hypothetical protein [Bradyrhizobium uaiense]